MLAYVTLDILTSAFVSICPVLCLVSADMLLVSSFLLLVFNAHHPSLSSTPARLRNGGVARLLSARCNVISCRAPCASVLHSKNAATRAASVYAHSAHCRRLENRRRTFSLSYLVGYLGVCTIMTKTNTVGKVRRAMWQNELQNTR